jgi:hypothetical protein
MKTSRERRLLACTVSRFIFDNRSPAEAFVDGVRLFETTTPDGLKRIAAAIEKAQGKSSDAER